MTADASSSRRKTLWVTALLHAAVAFLVFLAPDLLITYLKPQRPAMYYAGLYGRTLSLLAIFYLNYFVLIRRCITSRPRRVWVYVLCNLALAAAFLWGMWMLAHAAPPRRHHHGPEMMPLARALPMLTRDFAAALLTVALSLAARMSESWSRLDRRHQQVLQAQRQEQLTALRSQLSPHAVFNTLNTVYALIDIDTEAAKQAVHTLSKLLRYTLYDNPQSVPLASELELARNYASLMELRLGPGRVRLAIDAAGAEGIKVPPLLMLPLIENAFKHSRSSSAADPIEISITARPGEGVTCVTRNAFVPAPASPAPGAGGIGLANLRQRLDLLFGPSAKLSTATDGGVFTARLSFPSL